MHLAPPAMEVHAFRFKAEEPADALRHIVGDERADLVDVADCRVDRGVKLIEGAARFVEQGATGGDVHNLAEALQSRVAAASP